MEILALIVGGLLGALLGGLFGDGGHFVFGAVLGWLLVRSLRQAQQIERLQQRVDAMSSSAPIVDAPSPSPLPSPLPSPSPSPPPPVRPAEPPATPPSLPVTNPPQPRAAPAASIEAIATWPAGEGGRRLQQALRWLTGGNTIVKAGIGVLFIGLAFLAKYASERARLPVGARLAGIGGVAIALLVIGWRLRLRRPAYAQVLQGGAVAVLYLTLFVAFRYFGVIGVVPAFILMALVAGLAAALAVAQDASALAIIGALGGFATPLLVATGSRDPAALFSYYLVLDLGLAAVAWHKTWRRLNLVGFAGTYLVGAGWGVLRYDPAEPGHWASSQTFLILYFLLFIAVMLMPARRLPPAADRDTTSSPLDRWVNGGLLFGLPTISYALEYGLVRDSSYGPAIAALAFALFYAALAAGLRSRPRMSLVADASIAIATAFATLALPLAFDAQSTAGAWALEGAGLVWLGLRQSRGIVRLFGYTLLACAGLAMSIAYERLGEPQSWIDASLINAGIIAAASLVAARALSRQADRWRVDLGEAWAEAALIAWATLWLGVAAQVRISAFVPSRMVLAAWLGAASGITLIYVSIGSAARWRTLLLPAMAHAPLLALATLFWAFGHSSVVANGGAWAWPLAIAVHAVVLWRAASSWPQAAAVASHTLGALVVAALGAMQGHWLASAIGEGSAWPWAGALVVPVLLLILLSRPAAMLRWPMRQAPMAYASLAAGMLAAATLAWTLLANLNSDGSAPPLPDLPLANPLDSIVLITLFAAVAWLRSRGAQELEPSGRQAAIAVIALAGFVELNALLLRAFHDFSGVPYRLDDWLATLPVQTAVALLWTVTALALMWHATRRVMRGPWMAGAGLIAAVVLKLLLIDLAGSGTVTRIVSFIGVGVLLLVIGYVAPLPAKREQLING